MHGGKLGKAQPNGKAESGSGNYGLTVLIGRVRIWRIFIEKGQRCSGTRGQRVPLRVRPIIKKEANYVQA
jgi:hypothetical protein